MPHIYNQDGEQLGIVEGETGGIPDSESFGARLWEFFNPMDVKAEYEAVGKEAPTYWEIYTDSFDGMVNAAREEQIALKQGIGEVAQGATKLLGIVAVIAVSIAAIQGMQHLPKQKRRK